MENTCNCEKLLHCTSVGFWDSLTQEWQLSGKYLWKMLWYRKYRPSTNGHCSFMIIQTITWLFL